MFQGKHLLSTGQFERKGLEEFLAKASEMKGILERGEIDERLRGKIMATLFFEASTRTRFSFETAMNRLGGRVVSNADMMGTSSYKKRETLWDTGKVVSQMVDIIAMRHPEAGAVAKLSEGSEVPVLNAGDGPNEHPTQALLDLFTIYRSFGKVDSLKVAMVGDLKYGRVPHSDLDLLRHFEVDFVFVAPEALGMPEEFKAKLRESGRKFEETENLDACLDADVVMSTRIQEERFESRAEADKYMGVYVFDEAVMNRMKPEAILMHPLPRVDEIAKLVDLDKRAKYFEQVGNGVAARMAVLSKIFNV